MGTPGPFFPGQVLGGPGGLSFGLAIGGDHKVSDATEARWIPLLLHRSRSSSCSLFITSFVHSRHQTCYFCITTKMLIEGKCESLLISIRTILADKHSFHRDWRNREYWRGRCPSHHRQRRNGCSELQNNEKRAPLRRQIFDVVAEDQGNDKAQALDSQRAFYFQVDITDKTACASAVQKALQVIPKGSLSGCVHCAAISPGRQWSHKLLESIDVSIE